MAMRRRVGRFLAFPTPGLVVMSALVLALALSPSPLVGARPIAAPVGSPASPPQAGGTLTVLRGSDPASLDPAKVFGAASLDGLQASAVFDTLLYRDHGAVVPQTAESLVTTDGVVWMLKLRANIKFSDGTPYDAAAVKFNWSRIQDPANSSPRAAEANTMQALDVVDPLTLRVTLKSKTGTFPNVVAAIPFIGSPTAIQRDQPLRPRQWAPGRSC
jgi:peptide/nickel transport system substrate-binding protein